MVAQHHHGFSVSTKPWSITGTECQGRREAPYSETPEVNSGISAGMIKSISAMPHYKDRSHEELRLEESRLLKGYSFPSQSAFQQSSPLFGPLTSLVPSSEPSFRATATLVSDASVKPTIGTGFGYFPFGGSTGDGFVGRDLTNSAFGTSSTKMFSPTNNSRPTSSAFGVSSASSSFGITSTPGFLSGTSNKPVSTTSVFSSGSTSASRSNSIFGIQTSPGSQSTTSTKYQGSRPGFSATVERENNRDVVGNMQSISAMPFHKDKSHEELRSEDYGLCNACYKGGQTLWGAPFSRSSCLKTSDTPSNIFSFAPLSNQSSVPSPFQMFKSTLSKLERENSILPSTTISTAPTLSPSVNPFSYTNVYHSQPQAFTPAAAPFVPSFTPTLNPPSLLPSTEPMVKSSYQFPNVSTTFTNVYAPLSKQFPDHSLFQPLKSYFSEPATASLGATLTSNLNPPSLIPFTEPMLKNNCECTKVATTFTSSSVGTFSFTKPSVFVSPFIQFTPTTSSDPWSPIKNASQPQQTAEKLGPLSTNDLNTPSQASSGLTTVTQFTSQNINGQQYIASSNSSMQSSLVVNPFATRFPINQPNADTSGLHGIRSLPVSNNLSSNRRTSLLRIRHVSSKYPGLPTQKTNGRSSETKVPFFVDDVDKLGPVDPFLPRENPRAWVNISSLSLRSPCHSKGAERLSGDMSTLLNQHEHEVAEITEADVATLLPKLPDGEEYYTEPSLCKLAAKEMAEAGFCKHVKDFVVGRQGYGNIKFLGETDICHLDIESTVQFKNRQVVVYPDETKKPRVGQQLNKAAELTLLNVKCSNKNTGELYVEGHQVEKYKEILIKRTQEQGAEFVSYDPVEGEWKFRVQHF
ncbi:nuclear pore complex protein NUP98B-like isoform X2 [Salvia miltiorrhiza]|uniref:nuclear pore complex protein NUP98B-like isoform X2 n=1 Tax=Salvia miltiorrhiza TaxID=226208 RepID=UPI0025ACDF98|nr:nuclear pore complex protein NUP98B-like isoform X2 [Salvia miltiorrhiza]